MTETLDETAQRIAEHGREALLARLRPAFEEAASKHSDVLTLDEDQIEAMVQSAADRADGLQWRRALAEVATDQLGIGLGEALGHPAVERAQALVGAPSYEESLAALGAKVEKAQKEHEQIAEDEPEEPETEAQEPEEQPEEDDDDQPLHVPAVHLGGIANLSEGEDDIEVRFSDEGFDIVRPEGKILGRLTWEEVRSFDVPTARARRRRRRPNLVIHTVHGDASFNVRDIPAAELKTRIDRIAERHLPKQD